MRPGYTIKEWQQILDGELSYLGRGISTLTPFAGLTSNALAHLREDWITWRDKFIQIDIPETATCNSYKLAGGSGTRSIPPIEPRSDPCPYCRKEGTTDHFEHRWQGFDNQGTEPYTAVIHRELAEPAVDFLTTVFQTYDRPELAASPESIHVAARETGNKTIESKRFSYSKFLRTGPVIYRHYGLSVSDIADLTPYEEESIEQIIRATPLADLKNKSTLTVLRAISEDEPITAKALGEKLGISRSAAQRRINRLHEEGRVVGSNTGFDSPQATWKLTSYWADPFQCERCDFESKSLAGIRKHRSEEHG